MDSGSNNTQEQQRIMGRYQDMGYHVIIVGGELTDFRNEKSHNPYRILQ